LQITDALTPLPGVSDSDYELALAQFQGLFSNWKDVLYEMIRQHEACRQHHNNEEPHWGACPFLAPLPTEAALLQGSAKINRVNFDGTGTLRSIPVAEYEAALTQFEIDFADWKELLMQAIQEHQACFDHHDNVEPHWGPCPSPAAPIDDTFQIAPAASLLQITDALTPLPGVSDSDYK